MYNRVFTKILDSSIWLEPDSTRIVWLTLIASMDEDGFCPFACAANLANRARVELEKTQEAIKVLEGPDPNSADPEHDGRRIERVPGGWIVLNAGKYREMATRATVRESTRRRVQAYRERQRGNADVTPGNEEKRKQYQDQEQEQKQTHPQPGDSLPTPEQAVRRAHGAQGEPATGNVIGPPETRSPDGSLPAPPENPEEQVAAIGHLHPGNAHLAGKALPSVQEHAIVDAIIRDGYGLVLAGTRNLAEAASRWPPWRLRFLPNPVKFYRDSEYLKDPRIWEHVDDSKAEQRAKSSNDAIERAAAAGAG